MTGYIGLTLWMVVPLIISYGLYRLDMPKEFVITFMMIGLNIAIYWIVITAAIIIYGVQKYMELGSMDLFIKEFMRSIRD